MRKALFSLSAMLAATLPAIAADADDVRSGRELVRQICAECHAVRPAEVESPNRRAPSFEDIAGVAGMTPIALKVALRSSHREMPNLILNENEIEQVVAYILSLPGDRR
ncbi:MAG: cytochrome c [Pseudorhodoplanes sp.]|jgi:mono/diheme cytochrome c family protein|nr:cytochrome c [Pseudorhodoplanes sp.]